MISFTLSGKLKDGRTVLITKLRELAALFWETLGAGGAVPNEIKIDALFVLVTSSLMAAEVGKRITLAPLLQCLGFQDAVLVVHGIRSQLEIGPDGMPGAQVEVRFTNLQGGEVQSEARSET